MELSAHCKLPISIFVPTHAKSEGRKAYKIWSPLSSWVSFYKYTRFTHACIFSKHCMCSNSCSVELVSSISFCFLLSHSFHQAIIEKYPRRWPVSPVTPVISEHLVFCPVSQCLLVDLARDSGMGSHVTFWGHSSDSACICTFSLWSHSGHVKHVLASLLALLIDSLASLLWNWNMFPRSCIYKC